MRRFFTRRDLTTDDRAAWANLANRASPPQSRRTCKKGDMSSRVSNNVTECEPTVNTSHSNPCLCSFAVSAWFARPKPSFSCRRKAKTRSTSARRQAARGKWLILQRRKTNSHQGALGHSPIEPFSLSRLSLKYGCDDPVPGVFGVPDTSLNSRPAFQATPSLRRIARNVIASLASYSPCPCRRGVRGEPAW